MQSTRRARITPISRRGRINVDDALALLVTAAVSVSVELLCVVACSRSGQSTMGAYQSKLTPEEVSELQASTHCQQASHFNLLDLCTAHSSPTNRCLLASHRFAAASRLSCGVSCVCQSPSAR